MAVSFDKLHWMHLGAALAHGAQSGMAFALTNGKYKDQGKFTITNQIYRPEGPGAVNETNEIGTFRLGNLVGAFPALSTLNHLWAFFDRKRYERYVNDGYNPGRWLEFSASVFFMNSAVSILSSQSDVKALINQGLGNIALQYVGYMVEKQVSFSKKSSSLVPYQTGVQLEIIGFGILAAIWIPIMTSFFTSLDRSRTDEQCNESECPPNDSIYSIIIVLTLLYLSFGFLSILYVRSAGRKKRFVVKDFKKVEMGYIVLSLVAKSFLTNMTLFGALFSTENDKKN